MEMNVRNPWLWLGALVVGGILGAVFGYLVPEWAAPWFRIFVIVVGAVLAVIVVRARRRSVGR